jgi:hypothetical protein
MTLPPALLLEQSTMVHYWRGLDLLSSQLLMKQGGHEVFTWFRPLERNMLHPQDELYCYVYSSRQR